MYFAYLLIYFYWETGHPTTSPPTTPGHKIIITQSHHHLDLGDPLTCRGGHWAWLRILLIKINWPITKFQICQINRIISPQFILYWLDRSCARSYIGLLPCDLTSIFHNICLSANMIGSDKLAQSPYLLMSLSNHRKTRCRSYCCQIIFLYFLSLIDLMCTELIKLIIIFQFLIMSIRWPAKPKF